MSTNPSDASELTFTRVFHAPRELVFRCMIEPEHLTHFWGPVGVTAPIEHITVDPRPGGVFQTVMVNETDGSRYPTSAVYTDVTEPERLAWTETGSGMTMTATFSDLGDGRTEVLIRQTNAPEAFRSPQAQAGFLTSLDRFARHLAHLTAGAGRQSDA